MASVLISYTDSAPGDPSRRRLREFQLKAPDDASFARVAIAAIEDVPSGNKLSLVVEGALGHSITVVRADVTMKQAEEFADGAAIPLDAFARGGEWFASLSTLIGDGLTLHGLYALVSEGREKAFRAYTKKHRAAASRWINAGVDTEPDTELRQLVLAEPCWPRTGIERRFDLSPADAATLLRRLGYRQVESDRDEWQEDVSRLDKWDY